MELDEEALEAAAKAYAMMSVCSQSRCATRLRHTPMRSSGRFQRFRQPENVRVCRESIGNKRNVSGEFTEKRLRSVARRF